MIQIQNAFYLVPLCDAAYVRKQTSTSAPVNAVMMIQCLWAGQSNCLAGACTIEGKGTDHPWHIQNMAVALGFHPNQMQNNAVNVGHLLISGTSFPIAFVFLFILLSFVCLTLPNTSLSQPVLSTCPFLRRSTIHAKWPFLITHKYPSHSSWH